MELQPGTWNHMPVGTNFAGFGYAYTEGDIFVDPTLLLEDVKFKNQTLVRKYIRTFKLFDKSARVDLTQGWQEGNWEGLLNGVKSSISRNGLSDTLLRFALNLYGAPPLSGKSYKTYRSEKAVETILGTGLTVRLPTGEYMEDKLLNIGKNRFGFRPQLGMVHTRGKWRLELTGEVAFYTDNSEFYNGQTLEQAPLFIIQSHLTHTFTQACQYVRVLVMIMVENTA